LAKAFFSIGQKSISIRLGHCAGITQKTK
jgi:hypothetical protein